MTAVNLAHGCMACLHVPVYKRRGSVCELAEFVLVCVEHQTHYNHHLKMSPSIIVRGIDTHMHCVIVNSDKVLRGSYDASTNKPKLVATRMVLYEGHRVVQNLSSIVVKNTASPIFDSEAAFLSYVPSAQMETYAKSTTEMQLGLLRKLLHNIQFITVIDSRIEKRTPNTDITKRQRRLET